VVAAGLCQPRHRHRRHLRAGPADHRIHPDFGLGRLACSERLHNWLLQHPRFGPAIANWQAHGAVSRYGKWMATITMAVCAGIMLWCVPIAWVKWFSIGSMTVVAIWLWTRPLPPPAD